MALLVPLHRPATRRIGPACPDPPHGLPNLMARPHCESLDQSQPWLKPPAVLSPPLSLLTRVGLRGQRPGRPLPSAPGGGSRGRAGGEGPVGPPRLPPSIPGHLTAGGGRASGRAGGSRHGGPPHLTSPTARHGGPPPPLHLTHRPTWRPSPESWW